MRLLPSFRDCPADQEIPGMFYKLSAIEKVDWAVVDWTD